MRKLIACFAALLAVVGSTSGAMADGGSLKDDPAPVAEARSCNGGPFAGFYIGGAIGYAEQDTKNTDVSPEDSGSVSYDDAGFAGSLYSGYNVQCGRLVVGYESDWNWMDSDNSFTDFSGGCGGGPCYTVASDIKWFSTARLRIGLVHSGNIMFYATGGLAYADVEADLNVQPLSFRASDDDLKFGWTAGGGVEFIRHGQWSLRAEALYMDFGDETYSYSVETCGIDCTARQKWDDDLWIARVGLTYRLGAREEVFAAPLK
jgi:outer membrane immunogenic protein